MKRLVFSVFLLLLVPGCISEREEFDVCDSVERSEWCEWPYEPYCYLKQGTLFHNPKCR